jgi:hypothetical protein
MSVECSPEDTGTYYNQTSEIYFAAYNPSPDVIFSDSLLSNLILIFTINKEFAPDESQDMFIYAFDSGMIKIYIQNFI